MTVHDLGFGFEQPLEQSADERSITEQSEDLLDLFSVSGLLEDRDGDLLPDSTRFSISLPDEIPASLGAALCNFAVRVGLETGGVALPLVRDGDLALRVRSDEGPARLKAGSDGWLASGSSDDLAEHLRAGSTRVAVVWPA